MRSLTRTLALELALLKLNVSNVAPGMVLTPFNQEAIEDPRGAREVGAEHPVETSGPTRGGRASPCSLPPATGTTSPAFHLHDGRQLLAQPRPRRLTVTTGRTMAGCGAERNPGRAPFQSSRPPFIELSAPRWCLDCSGGRVAEALGLERLPIPVAFSATQPGEVAGMPWSGSVLRGP